MCKSIEYSTKSYWHLNLLQGTRCNDLEILLLFKMCATVSRSACQLSRLLTSYFRSCVQASVMFIFALQAFSFFSQLSHHSSGPLLPRYTSTPSLGPLPIQLPQSGALTSFDTFACYSCNHVPLFSLLYVVSDSVYLVASTLGPLL